MMVQSETTKTHSTLQACSFSSNPFLEFCPQPPLFLPWSCSTRLSKHLTHENSTASLWKRRYSEKGDLLEHFASTFSLVMPFSHESEHTKLMTSRLSTYRWQFSTANHFHVKWSTNPRVTSILPKASISLCALPGRFQLRYYFSKFPPRISLCYFGLANHFIPFVFEFSLRP